MKEISVCKDGDEPVKIHLGDYTLKGVKCAKKGCKGKVSSIEVSKYLVVQPTTPLTKLAPKVILVVETDNGKLITYKSLSSLLWEQNRKANGALIGKMAIERKLWCSGHKVLAKLRK